MVIAPHVDPPRTPLLHDDHVLAAYRLPLLFDMPHARLDPDQQIVAEEGLFDAAASLVLALLAALSPRLPRPTLRAGANVERARIARALWRPQQLTDPPRIALHT